MLAVAVIVMGGVLATQGGAVQVPAPGKPSAQVAARGEAVVHAHGGQAFSTEAQRRAILDHEWDKEMQARCGMPSPFTARAALAPVC